MEIIFCEGKSFLSRAIAWFTFRRGVPKMSHVAIRYSDPEATWCVEASKYGVMPDWYVFLKLRYKNIYRFKVNLDNADEALDWVISTTAHKKYDYLEIVGFMIKIFLGWAGIKINNPLGSADKYICSELVKEWLLHIQRLNSVSCPNKVLPFQPLSDFHRADNPTPTEIYEIIAKSSYFQRIYE